MIEKKAFYFIRHGQTNHNISTLKDKGDHHHSVPLNETGRAEAKSIEPKVSLLPVKAICVSPMVRVQETKEIACASLKVPHYNIDNLRECGSLVWHEMRKRGMYADIPTEGIAHEFIHRVKDGINEALSLPAPVLVVAHGGIFWALCCLMGIDKAEWAIENCGMAHFSISSDGKWKVNRNI